MSNAQPDPHQVREDSENSTAETAAQGWENPRSNSIPSSLGEASKSNVARAVAGRSRGRRRRRGRQSSPFSKKTEESKLTSQPWFIVSSFLLALGFAVALTYFMARTEHRLNRVNSSRPTNQIPEKPDSQDKKEAATMVNSAYFSLAKGNVFEAFKKFKEIHQLYPDLPGVLKEISLLGERLRIPEEADEFILAANNKNVNVAENALLLMRAANRLGQTDRVLSHFEQAHLADPTNASILHLWGDALRLMGRNLEAEEKYTESLLRSDSATLAFLVELKLELTRLELHAATRGPAIESANEVDADGGRFLIAAAAASLSEQGGYKEKEQFADFLREARHRLPAPIYNYLIADPIFQRREVIETYPDIVQTPKRSSDKQKPRILP